MDRLPDGSRRDGKDQNASVGMGYFLPIHLHMDSLMNALDRAFRHVKGLGADDLAWTFVGDAQHHPTAAFVCQRHAIIHKLLEIKAFFRFLKFYMLAF